MSEQENRKETGRKLLLIFSENGCMREKLPVNVSGEYTFFLSAEVTGGNEREIRCHAEGQNWYVCGQLLSENTPLYIQEEIQMMFLLSDVMGKSYACQRLILEPENILRVGKAYRSTVFYESFSLVLQEHFEIFYEDGSYVLHCIASKGIYLNERAITGKHKLGMGDRIDLYGLHILVLGELLAICVFQGICRVAGRGSIDNLMIKKVENVEYSIRLPERYRRKEEILHTGEAEILPPPPGERQQQKHLLLSLGPSMTMIFPMLLMAAASSYFQPGSGGTYFLLSVIMSACSSMLALFWGLTNHFYVKHQSKKAEHKRVSEYLEYLKKTKEMLVYYKEENRRILIERYPFADFFFGEGNKILVMWDRYYRHKEFWFLPVGRGCVPFQMQIKKPAEKSIIPEVLIEEAGKIADEFSILTDVPIGIYLDENKVVGIAGKECVQEGAYGVLLQLLIQVAACHSYAEMKVICFYDKRSLGQREITKIIKWMPHCWSDNLRARYLMGDESELADILPLLHKELESSKDRDKGRGPWYLAVVLSDELIRGEAFYKYLTEPAEHYPMSSVFVKKKRETLPAECGCILSKTDCEEEMIFCSDGRSGREKVQLEVCKKDTLETYVRELSGYRIGVAEADNTLPEKISFLELYQCETVGQLDCIGRWKKNKPEERLKIPIGVRAGGGCVFLDIHEKFHGPHGLIAGTTGSGKSELIQTCLLSMAVSFSPVDVNFFMIDYKGGGTGNILQALPHCAGIISNLSGKQIKRAMSAISSENKRRQKLLSNHQLNHIDSYMELYRLGKVSEPMPHLLLVIDEFAELRKEEPEFMQEIISLAQVGRSLGMHLILATQKPAGTVDDKIWSNARFRLCLRVQDRQDSMDMLHQKDAALLTHPGQCYLQIGNNEYYELFQTAYCGGVYREKGEKKEQVLLVQNTGKRIKEYLEDKGEENGTQLENAINYVNQMAEKHDYAKARRLWMPELEEKLVLSTLQKKFPADEVDKSFFWLGLYDDPENQQQYPALYDPGVQGHLAVFGNPVTGKTTLLQMLLYQMMQRPMGETEVLLVDLDGSLWQGIQYYPNLLGYITREEDIQVFFYHLENLIRIRKEKLAGMHYRQYRKSGKGQVPEVFFVIDSYSSLSKLLDEKQEEVLLRIASEGIKNGVYLILSALQVGELPGKLFGKIKKTVVFEMSDTFAYGDALRQYQINVLPKENIKGRGLSRENDRILEFQTALAIDEENDYLRTEKLKEEGKQRNKELFQEEKSKKIIRREVFPRMSEKVVSSLLYKEFSWKDKPGTLPLGYDTQTGKIAECNMAGCFLLVGGPETDRSSFLAHAAVGLLRQGMEVAVYDSTAQLSFLKDKDGIYLIEHLSELQRWRQSIEHGEEGKSVCLLIGDLNLFVRKLYESKENDGLHKFVEKEAGGCGHLKCLIGCSSPEADYEVQGTVFFREFLRWQQGICLGGNLAMQRYLTFDDISYSMQNKKESAQIGYFKKGTGSVTRRLKLPVYEEG